MQTKRAETIYVIIWQYRVKAENMAAFEETYSTNGAWTKLFQKSTGFRGTELLRGEHDPLHYITVDRWRSRQEYDSFLLEWHAEYAALDARCAELTQQEALLGRWETVLPETR